MIYFKWEKWQLKQTLSSEVEREVLAESEVLVFQQLGILSHLLLHR